MENKLQSMTDFVLEQLKIQQSTSEFKEVVKNYAQFLKQPLTLGMLTTIREDGKHIKEPIAKNTSQKRYPYEIRDFNLAKSKVLFKKNCDFIPFLEALDIIKHLKTVEDLLKITYDLELTESAIKQIGL